MSEYPPPVAELLTLGEKPLREPDWLDYRARGIGPEHVPDLIRLADTWVREDEDDLDWDTGAPWAPVHAWRALGQLRAAEASEVLFQIVRRERETDADWANGEMAFVFGEIGPGALPVLSAALANSDLDPGLRWAAAEGIEEIGKEHPESRAECVALLTGQLEKSSANDPELNGGLIAGLLDLKAVESAPVIERAFAAGDVDEWIAGDWEMVRYELGLGPPPAPRPPVFPGPIFPGGPGFRVEPVPTPKTRAQERSRNRKKQAKQSKKKNRKKKK